MKVLRSKKTGKYYNGLWHEHMPTWLDSIEYCRKYNYIPIMDKHKAFLDSKGLDMEAIEVTKKECYN